MFARRETEYQTQAFDRQTKLEWGDNDTTLSLSRRANSALALAQLRISMMRRAGVHCFVNIVDQWRVIDTYRRGEVAGAREKGKRHLVIKLRAWVIARVDHPLLFQAVSNKFDRIPSPRGRGKKGYLPFASDRSVSRPRDYRRHAGHVCVPPLSIRSFIKPSRNFPRRRLLSFVRSSAGSDEDVSDTLEREPSIPLGTSEEL